MRRSDDLSEAMSRVAGGFNIVVEARMRSLYQLKKKHCPDMTLEQLTNFVTNILEDEAKKQGDLE